MQNEQWNHSSSTRAPTLTRRSVLRGSGMGAIGVLTGVSGETAAAVTRDQEREEGPHTIPAIRHWTSNGRSYTYDYGSRIVLDSSHASALEADAETFADDLTALTGIRSPVIPDHSSNPHTSDLFLTLDTTDDDLGEQGYRMTVDDMLTISARTPTGVFYGTRTVLQLLRQSRTIPGGVARDWPSYPERGVLVCNCLGREFPLAWWHTLIRELSYLKMNEIVLTVQYGTLTDTEIADLGAFSERYHVNITPQINRPGHSPYFLDEHPEYALDPDGPSPVDRSIDITKPGAREAIRNETETYLDEFPGDYWHTGGDEYLTFPGNAPPWDRYPQLGEFAREQTGNPNATGQDAYVWFMNWMNELVTSHGKTLRMWNDHLQSGGVLELDDDIIIDDWINSRGDPTGLSPQQLVERGHTLLNATLVYTFYDRGIDPRIIYEEFEPNRFHRQTVTDTENVLGARYQLWGLRDDTNEEILEDMFTRLRSLSQVVWQSPPDGADYDAFRSLMDRIGHAPGYGVDLEVQAPTPIYTGTEVQVTTSFTNNSGYAAHNVQMTLDGPKEWTAQPTSPAKFSTVARGKTVTTNWQVSVPRDYRITGDGNDTLTGAVTYYGRDDQDRDQSARTVQVVPHLEFDDLTFDTETDTREIHASVTVTNHLASSETIRVPLTVDGQILQSKTITVAGKSSRKVTFTVTPNEAGLHHVSIGESAQKSIGFSGRYSAFAATSVDATVDTTGNTVVIESNGLDIWAEIDEYGTVYLDDAIGSTETIVTKIESQEIEGNYQKSGIMVRNDITNAGSATGYVCVEVTPRHGPLVQWDSDEDGYCERATYVDPSEPASYPMWLKLERDGTMFTGYYSTDGSNWSEIDSVTVDSATATQDVGMFVTNGYRESSENRDELCRVEFSEFSVEK